jgi:hypothetical protein
LTSSISRSTPLVQSSGGVHRSSVFVHRGECMHMYVSICVFTVFSFSKIFQRFF